MRVVIAGGSSFAVEVAKGLLKRGIDKITLVIEDKEKAVEASTECPSITVVNSNPSKPDVLLELNLEKCDVFVAATKKEEISILAALYARDHKVKRIYVKITNDDTKKIIEKMGMKPIDISESASSNVVLDIAEPLIYGLVGVGESTLDMRERQVTNYPNIIGQRLGDIQGKFFNVIAVYQDGKFCLSSDTEIKDDASLILLEESSQDSKVVKELRKA